MATLAAGVVDEGFFFPLEKFGPICKTLRKKTRSFFLGVQQLDATVKESLEMLDFFCCWPFRSKKTGLDIPYTVFL